MIGCRRIGRDQLEDAISTAFAEDYEGLKKYTDPVNKIAVNTIDDAVQEQLIKLDDIEKEGIVLLHYRVIEGNNTVGYFSCFYNPEHSIFYLVSFGLKVQHRSREKLKQFFALMDNAMLNR